MDLIFLNSFYIFFYLLRWSTFGTSMRYKKITFLSQKSWKIKIAPTFSIFGFFHQDFFQTSSTHRDTSFARIFGLELRYPATIHVNIKIGSKSVQKWKFPEISILLAKTSSKNEWMEVWGSPKIIKNMRKRFISMSNVGLNVFWVKISNGKWFLVSIENTFIFWQQPYPGNSRLKEEFPSLSRFLQNYEKDESVGLEASVHLRGCSECAKSKV